MLKENRSIEEGGCDCEGLWIMEGWSELEGYFCRF
jgi:hypothetical protein